MGIRSRVRARCGFGFICFSSSKLELNICLCGKKQVTELGHFVDEVSHSSFPKIPPEQTINRRVDIKL